MRKLYKILLVVIAGLLIASFANAYLSQYWKTISDIIPRTDNNVDIGTDAKRVKKIWTHDLSASSTITSATSTATTLTDGTLSITGGDLTTTGTIDAGNMAFEKVGTLISQKNPAYNEDFVIGSPQLADTGTSLHDTRMWYDKSKGAFRAGKASGDQWDDANVGNYSSAFGFNTKATTWGAVAFGAYTQALGLYSVSFGYASEALGKYAVSFGQSTLADCYADVVFGRYNVGGGNADAWVATDPILEVGIGTANDARANALTIYKDGNMEVAGSITTPSTVTASSYITGAFTLTVDETESLSSYLTSARAGTWLGTKDTGDLTEGTNLYYTDARVKTYADTLYLPIIADANVDLGVYDFTTTGTGTFGTTIGSRGVSSFAVGRDVEVSGYGSIALGNFVTASGYGSIAMGIATTASGYGSIAMGTATTASNPGSVAMGSSSTASGYSAVAMGSAEASGNGSMAIGGYYIHPGANSAGPTASATNSFAFGTVFTNSIANSFMVGFGQADFKVTSGEVNVFGDLTTSGTIQGGGYKSSDGTAGATATVTVRNQAGDGTCDLVFKNGLFISTTCP